MKPPIVLVKPLRVVAFAIRHSRETCRLHARARIYLGARELCNL
jgi:hypothetical protein